MESIFTNQGMRSAQGEDKFVCCELRRQLAEEFAINARLYAEVVALFTSSHGVSQVRYGELLQKTSEAKIRAEQAQAAFEEHVARHQCEMLLAKSQQV